MAVIDNALPVVGSFRHVRRFAVIGTLSTVIDIGLFTVLRVFLGMPALGANTISYCAGIVNAFVFHRRWTFADRPHKAAAAQFTQFALVSFGALLLNNAVVVSLSPALAGTFRQPAYADLAAKLAATAVVMGWNYFVNNVWTFRDEPRPRTRRGPS
jgi:putative flippase GtrA